MDRISGLSDDVLVKILSYLPTKVAVSTSLLSKRWDFLWMSLPKLEYVTRSLSESEKLQCFLNRTLPLHRAPVIESFRLSLTHKLSKPEDVKLWVLVAVTRQLRELDIRYNPYSCKQELLPSSLYACKSLEILKLGGEIVLDVPRMVCLPSLKILKLVKVTGVDGESLQRLLSMCPLLEKLSVVFCGAHGNISVISPSLLSLSLRFENYSQELEIDTPCLKYLKLHMYFTFEFSIRNMPKLEEANVDVSCHNIDCLFRSITSVKRLTICCAKYVNSDSLVFNQLDHLKLCNCDEYSANFLTRLLKDSPNLRVLEIFQMEDHDCSDMMYWNEPSTVPKCILSTLQTFNWSGYLGRPANREVVVYILKNACRLKTATISSHEDSIPEKYQMFKELARSPRASATCELIFD